MIHFQDHSRGKTRKGHVIQENLYTQQAHKSNFQ
jgi:hypothetical protein